MKYDVRLKPAAVGQLKKLNKQDLLALAAAMTALGGNPRPIKGTKLAWGNLHRIRVGNYRIVYEVDDANRVILITKVARRSESTYKNL